MDVFEGGGDEGYRGMGRCLVGQGLAYSTAQLPNHKND